MSSITIATIADVEKHIEEQKIVAPTISIPVEVEKEIIDQIATMKTVDQMTDEEVMVKMRSFFHEHNKGKITVIKKQTSSSDDEGVQQDVRVEELQTIARPSLVRPLPPRFDSGLVYQG